MKTDSEQSPGWYSRNALVIGVGIKFILYLAIFLYFLTSSIAQKELLPRFAAAIPIFASGILRAFGIAAHASGTQIIGAIQVQINNACSGGYETASLAAAILATRADWMHRVVGLAIATITIYCLNTMRAACLFTIGLYRPSWFHIAHEYVFQTIMVFAFLSIYMAWAYWVMPKAR